MIPYDETTTMTGDAFLSRLEAEQQRNAQEIAADYRRVVARIVSDQLLNGKDMKVLTMAMEELGRTPDDVRAEVVAGRAKLPAPQVCHLMPTRDSIISRYQLAVNETTFDNGQAYDRLTGEAKKPLSTADLEDRITSLKNERDQRLELWAALEKAATASGNHVLTIDLTQDYANAQISATGVKFVPLPKQVNGEFLELHRHLIAGLNRRDASRHH